MEPESPATDAAKSSFKSIALDQIGPSRHQARKKFDEESIKNLAESMRQEGLLQPITIRTVSRSSFLVSGSKAEDQQRETRNEKPETSVYELVSGERRLRAAKLLGWAEIDAKVIQPVSEGEVAAKGLIENLQREDLNSIEEAEGFLDLKSMDSYWNQERIADIAGKSPDYVSRSLALLGLPPEVVEKLRQRNLTREHGIELLRINNAKEQKRLADKVGKKGMTVRQTRETIDKKLSKGGPLCPPAIQSEPDLGQARGPAPTASFKFVKRGSSVAIRASLPEAGDLDKFLADLRAAYLDWSSRI